MNNKNWIIGNSRCCDELLAAYSKFSNWLVLGQHGLGKFAMLKKFAEWLLPNCASDLYVVRKNGDFIGVDDVRKIAYFAIYPPSVGDWKIVIIDGLDYLTYSASNASLKLLEDHSSYVLFFLIASSSGMVMDTISSRCRKLRFGLLSDGEMNSLPILQNYPLLEGGEIILARGSPGRLEKIIRNDGLAIYRKIVSLSCGSDCFEEEELDCDLVAYLVQVFLFRVVRFNLGMSIHEVFIGEFDSINSLDYNKFDVCERYKNFLSQYGSGNFELRTVNSLLY